MGDIMNNDELMHYGVLGMHWGVRRGQTGQTIAKAQRKMTKLDAKHTKAVNKRANTKRPLIRTDFSDAKFRRRDRNVTYTTAAARKWLKKVDKVLGTKTMNEMKNADGTNAARRYFEDIFSNT
jgi:hypothetical protein